MLKIFSLLKPTRSLTDTRQDASPSWARDPLQHPDLERMDGRELGDLPFPGWPWPRTGNCDCASAARR
ncbi:hypothetical protein [Ensifer canadensis]|uniref:hypothetical protein n=1 Tax=Ensifer canadensis TaxID=555315 RepID=UPI0035E3D40F